MSNFASGSQINLHASFCCSQVSGLHISSKRFPLGILVLEILRFVRNRFRVIDTLSKYKNICFKLESESNLSGYGNLFPVFSYLYIIQQCQQEKQILPELRMLHSLSSDSPKREVKKFFRLNWDSFLFFCVKGLQKLET